MDSMAPIGRERAIQLVTEGKLPISFRSAQPGVMILEQEGVFRIRAIVIDQADVAAAVTAAGRARSPSWMPAHHAAMGTADGEILLEAPTRSALVEAMRTMSWPETW